SAPTGDGRPRRRMRGMAPPRRRRHHGRCRGAREAPFHGDRNAPALPAAGNRVADRGHVHNQCRTARPVAAGHGRLPAGLGDRLVPRPRRRRRTGRGGDDRPGRADAPAPAGRGEASRGAGRAGWWPGAAGPMTRLSVNVNKIAVLRNSRGGGEPDVLAAARACLAAGAHGITVHPRPDRRHVVAEDLPPLADATARYGVEFNIEGNPFAPPREGYPGLLALCEQVLPAQVTLVPDSDGQLTSDHGFALEGDLAGLADQVAGFAALGCRVSLF